MARASIHKRLAKLEALTAPLAMPRLSDDELARIATDGEVRNASALSTERLLQIASGRHAESRLRPSGRV